MNSQRYLALAGAGSRRKCGQLIEEGRVTRNGERLTFGVEIQPGDDVRIDGQPVAAPNELVYFALNKPAGLISDRGVPGERSALDLAPAPERLFAVGRLDKDATGLLLLTNDGETAQRLTHPRYEHEKEYHVLVQGRPSSDAVRQWRRGVVIGQGDEAVITAPATVEFLRVDGGNTWLRVTLREGRKRQIKRVAKAVGHPVLQLIRVRIGPVELGHLRPGEWRRLSEVEIARLHEQVNGDSPGQPRDVEGNHSRRSSAQTPPSGRAL